MLASTQALDASIRSIDQLRRILSKVRARQVRALDVKDLIRATAFAWFNSTRPAVEMWQSTEEFGLVNNKYAILAEAGERNTLRTKYTSVLRELRDLLVRLRTRILTKPPPILPTNPGQPPDFSPLVADEVMRTILNGRWHETELCLGVGANLAAVVMMGGLLEGLLLARVNILSDKGPVFRASMAPKDKGGATLQLKDWTLKHYLDVAHELGWIARSARDVGSVLRDYRNYVHPEKQRSHGVTLTSGDAGMLWSVSVSLARQLVDSTRP